MKASNLIQEGPGSAGPSAVTPEFGPNDLSRKQAAQGARRRFNDPGTSSIEPNPGGSATIGAMFPSWIRPRLSGLLWAAALAGGVLPLAAGEQAQPGKPSTPRKSVLVINTNAPDIGQEIATALNKTLQAGSAADIDVYSEYPGLDYFSEAEFESGLAHLYNKKYAERKVDLLVLLGPTALEFVLSKGILPGVPVVACYVPNRDIEKARQRRPELTAALVAQNAPSTIALMLSLFPGTKQIHVVLGATPYEREQSERARTIFKPFDGQVGIDYWNDLSLEQMEQRAGQLSSSELILFASLLQDSAGREFHSDIPENRICRASHRPFFGVLAQDLGEGITGGILLDTSLSGKAAGELALRILSGERASSILPLQGTGAAPMFDARELDRHGIPEAHLPPGAIIRFKRTALWETYWKEFATALAIISIETVLVAGLIIQLRRRKRTELALATAEQRYRTVADFTHDWEFWQRPDGGFDYVSPACERLSGYTQEEFRTNPALLSKLVSEEDRPAWETYQAEVLAGREEASFQYRIRVRDGSLRWVEQASNPVTLDGSRLAGSRGSIRDITDRKQDELNLRKAYGEIAVLKDRLEAENTYYRDKIQSQEGSDELLGVSDSLKYLLYRIRQVAPSGTTVLIQGETGTGKELVSEAIHKLSTRSDRPLVKINCAALPPGLAESELFGHEKGAFTGAQNLRKGRFELADKGTLFLDEVGELSPEVQAKLLRVLQEGEFQRVGGDRTLKVDVRVIAATNRDLGKEVAAGRFREDLWYRLNVFPLTVPPLRERKEDILVLAQSFLARFCQKLGRPILDLPKSVIQALEAYPWPGNVRELQNIMERAVLVSEGNILRLADPLTQGKASETPTSDPGQSLQDIERQHILQVLTLTSWKLEGAQGAAAQLGLKPSTLRHRMAKLGFERPKNLT